MLLPSDLNLHTAQRLSQGFIISLMTFDTGIKRKQGKIGGKKEGKRERKEKQIRKEEMGRKVKKKKLSVSHTRNRTRVYAALIR